VEAQPLVVVVQPLVAVPQHSVLLHLVAATNKVVLLVRVTAMAEHSEVEQTLVDQVASAALVEMATVGVALERRPSQLVALVVSTAETTSNSKVTRSLAADLPDLDKIFSGLPFHNYSLRIFLCFTISL